MATYIKSCDGCLISDPQYKYYDYFNTEPQGHWFDCPNLAPSCSDPCAEGETCCSNQSQSGYIYSDDFPDDLFSCGKPLALIYAGSAIDNNGSLGGITFPSVSCESSEIARLTEDEIVDAEIDGKKLKLAFTAQNSALGGPYGLNSVSVMWYFAKI
jgi:hypothetical protein